VTATRFAAALVTTCALGCGSPAPTAPTLAPSPFAPEAASTCSPRLTCEVVSFQITGVATDDDGRPVPGANVTIAPWKFGPVAPRIFLATDAAGFYRAEFEAMRDAVGGVGNVVVEHSGYENNARYLGPAVPQEMTQNFHLYRIRRIAPGESVALTVRPNDPSCGFDGEWICRTVRIITPRAGTLTVTLTSHNPQNETGLEVFQRVPAGVSFRPRCCARHVEIEAEAGAEVVANVLVWWDTKAPHAFTLTTGLLP
jgi:hypothetical protein